MKFYAEQSSPLQSALATKPFYYGIQLVLEVTLLSSGLSVVLGIPLNSKSSTFDFHLATALYQSIADGNTASLYQFPYLFLAISTDNFSLRNWVYPLCNNVPVTTASNCVAKVFLLPQTKLHFVLLLFFIIMMFRPFAIVKLNLFCYLMPPKLSISLMACITSFHVTLLSA